MAPTADGNKGLVDEVSGMGEAGSTFRTDAPEASLLDYLHGVEHGAARIARLESAITEAV